MFEYVVFLVDGVFGNWSQWYDCSVTCGGGIQWKNRSCIGPFYGGEDCSGAFEESTTCNTHPCPSSHFLMNSIHILICIKA